MSNVSNVSNVSTDSEDSGGTVNVRIPTQLRSLTGGAGEVPVAGSTVGDVLASLETAHPGFGERLFDDQGKLRRFVNVFVADEDVRFLQGLETPIRPGQTLSIVPAVAGGA
ncbi:MAG TPA: ubiquitin-like small modifier protein 1 [Acidimicrobiales bacterium]|nr:ubiquitin-like small modifier protein 1 [Acidimicrobiales bacterium]